jgi:hypothetical protein
MKKNPKATKQAAEAERPFTRADFHNLLKKAINPPTSLRMTLASNISKSSGFPMA